MPPTTRGPFRAHLRTLPPPPELLEPVACARVPSFFGVLPLVRPPLRELQRFALGLAGCPLLPATSGIPGTEPRRRRVPATATRCCGTGVFIPAAPARRATAAGAHPGGACAARPTRSYARPLCGSPSHPPRGHGEAAAASLGPSCSLFPREPLS